MAKSEITVRVVLNRGPAATNAVDLRSCRTITLLLHADTGPEACRCPNSTG